MVLRENMNTYDICKNLVNFWKTCDYDMDEFSTNSLYSKHGWYLQTPKEFTENKCGICYDYVTFGSSILSNNFINFYTYYFYADTLDGDTHTFILVPYKNQYLYIEGAFKDWVDKTGGMKLFKSELESFEYIAKQLCDFYNTYQNLIDFHYYIWKYSGHPSYGCDKQEFTEYCTKEEPIYEGVMELD